MLVVRKPHKYGAKKTVVDGVKFDSKAESRRWQELVLLQRAGEISNLQRQVVYELAPKIKYDGAARATPALRMVVDFRYHRDGVQVVEDCKGMVTEGARIKRHLMKSVHGITVVFRK